MTLKQRLHEYSLLIRWHRPAPILLVLWPVLTALFIANSGFPSAKLMFIFVAGVFVMRSAGDIINDLIDIKIDKHVARTQKRPLAAGTVTVIEALILLALLLLIALVLVLLLNCYSLVLAIITLGLTVLYPFSKRFFVLPQGILGVAYNMGILIAFAASVNHLPFVAWLLLFISILWTIAYDGMYAICDRKDDLKLGLYSAAVWFGEHDRVIICGLQIVIIIALILLGWLINANLWYYSAIIATALSFGYQQLLIKDLDSDSCLAAFTNNHWSWFFIFFGVYLNYLR